MIISGGSSPPHSPGNSGACALSWIESSSVARLLLGRVGWGRLGTEEHVPEGGPDVKKLLGLAAVAGAIFLVVRRSRSAKAEADLWREATAPAANNGAAAK